MSAHATGRPATGTADRRTAAPAATCSSSAPGSRGCTPRCRCPTTSTSSWSTRGCPAGDSGSSPWAQGGLAAAIGPDDSPDAHAEDTIARRRRPVRPARRRHPGPRGARGTSRRLLELGAVLDRDTSESVPSARRASRRRAADPVAGPRGRPAGRPVGATGRRHRRRADAGPPHRGRAARDAAASASSASWDATPHGAVTGAHVLTPDGPVAVQARATILATGGCGGLFAATTNPDNATGDGLALAARAGAAVRDVEFVQFHPTGLAVGGTWRFLLTEALRGAGATLHGADGDAVPGRPPPRRRARAAPRRREGDRSSSPDGTAWLDATHLGARRAGARVPDRARRRTPARVRPGHRAGPGDPGGPLPRRRCAHRPRRAHVRAGPVRLRRGRLDRAARRQPDGVQLARPRRSCSAPVPRGRSPPSCPTAPGELGPDPAGRTHRTPTSPRSGATLREVMLTGAGPVRDGDGLAEVADRLARLVATSSADPAAGRRGGRAAPRADGGGARWSRPRSCAPSPAAGTGARTTPPATRRGTASTSNGRRSRR